MDFSGQTYCEAHHIVDCADDVGFEEMAPYVLWPATAFVTILVCLLAALIAPVARGERAAWAVMVGCSVFVAHRNNVVWAIIVTALAIWAVLAINDEMPDESRRGRFVRAFRRR